MFLLAVPCFSRNRIAHNWGNLLTSPCPHNPIKPRRAHELPVHVQRRHRSCDESQALVRHVRWTQRAAFVLTTQLLHTGAVGVDEKSEVTGPQKDKRIENPKTKGKRLEGRDKQTNRQPDRPPGRPAGRPDGRTDGRRFTVERV